MNIHESVTTEKVMAAVEDSHTGLSNPGFCVECGAETDGVEPDARKYECGACGAMAVYGAEELLFHLS